MGQVENCKVDDCQKRVLLAHLKQALRQWHMYAEMVENPNDCDLITEQTPEGEMYREAIAFVAAMEAH
jgi:hypothetical protein